MDESKKGYAYEELKNKKSTIDLKDGGTITVEEKTPNVFTIIDNNLTVKGGDPNSEATDLMFTDWDSNVKNLEDPDKEGNDHWQAFAGSQNLQWEDVVLTTEYIKAPSLDRLKEALQHLTITAVIYGDI